MSWSVNGNGTPEEAKTELLRQFATSLAESPAGLPDEGEKETVRMIRDMIVQCLGTFDSAKKVFVSANGHMAFDDWEKKSGRCQQVNISIR